MMNTENGSEVARLLSQIDTEYTAASRGLTGYTQGSRHAFIAARDRNIDAYRRQLIPLVGDRRATELVAQTIWPECVASTIAASGTDARVQANHASEPQDAVQTEEQQ